LLKSGNAKFAQLIDDANIRADWWRHPWPALRAEFGIFKQGSNRSE
jgi:hypothetical protein